MSLGQTTDTRYPLSTLNFLAPKRELKLLLPITQPVVLCHCSMDIPTLSLLPEAHPMPAVGGPPFLPPPHHPSVLRSEVFPCLWGLPVFSGEAGTLV